MCWVSEMKTSRPEGIPGTIKKNGSVSGSDIQPWFANHMARIATVTNTVDGFQIAPITLIALPDLLAHS